MSTNAFLTQHMAEAHRADLHRHAARATWRRAARDAARDAAAEPAPAARTTARPPLQACPAPTGRL